MDRLLCGSFSQGARVHSVYIQVWLYPFCMDYFLIPFVSFVGEKGQGIELFFQNEHSLGVKVVASGKQAQKVVLRPGGDFKFQTKTWYYIALTHSSHFIRATEISLYINGKKAVSCSLNYPKADEV